MRLLHQINFQIKNQFITRTDSFFAVAKSKNYLYAKFDFLTDEWSGTKTAIFKMKDNIWNQIIEDDGTCLVPWEFLDVEEDSVGKVSVFCGSLITANEAVVKVNKSGYGKGAVPDPPTEDIYEQIIKKWDDGKVNAERAENAADRSETAAEKSEQIASEIPDYVENAKSDIDEYVQQKEHELKGETGDVSFASFAVVPPKLYMYNDTSKTHINFEREGSKLYYQWIFPERNGE